MSAPRSIDGVIRPAAPVAPAPKPAVPSFAGPRQAVDIRPGPRRPLPKVPERIPVSKTVALPKSPTVPLEAPKTPKRWRKLREYIQFAAIMAAAMLLGILAQSLIFGQMVIAAYGVAALLLRIKSSTTFGLAIISIVTVVVFFTLSGNGALANNFAVYTFWLLVIGTLSLLIEVRAEQKAKNTTKK